MKATANEKIRNAKKARNELFMLLVNIEHML
jgi:hypothetical protein